MRDLPHMTLSPHRPGARHELKKTEDEKRTTTMKRLTPILAAVVALSLNVAAATASEASAQTAHENRSEFKVAFSFNPNASPDGIYASLRTKADGVCRTHGPRSLRQVEQDRACAEKLLTSAVNRVGRADVAALHKAAPITLAGS
jgi:hypothetical protein